MSESEGWPVALRGITETVVATQMPDGSGEVEGAGGDPKGDAVRYNLAALGLHPGDPVTARTWGRTRTWRGFRETGGGVVQFTDDPLCFVEAALGIVERERPVHPSAGAWVEVAVESVDAGETDGTRWEEWALVPEESAVGRRSVARLERGPAAVVEASVWASRLDVPGHDRSTCEDRIAFFGSVVDRCGGDRAREAFSRLEALAGIEG